ncbi:succinate-semialdehyde dehydrogenase [Fusarium longipes]|uniref:Succinate-semialdehyde dehydrogenase n=1 Tax=Fusarium longipes TaxID=694270 RepID=A0A395T331_9HYPO|nr:succinate-semialdehyde dehydrogenase [Fusarium longipes]
MSPRETQQETGVRQRQSISETAFYGLSEADALSADSGISMPPSPPQLEDSCMTALFDSFDFTGSLGNFNSTHPFLDIPMNEDPWPVPTSPPVASHDSIIDPRLRSAPWDKDPNNSQSPIERLSNLQQELLRTKLPSTHARESGSQHQPAKCVESAMKPVQETLGVVTDLMHQCVKKGGDGRNSVCPDWQTIAESQACD